MLKYLGLLLAVVSWLLASMLILRWRNHEFSTISRHAAQSKKARLFFGLLLIVGGAVLYYWLASWFALHLRLGLSFKIVLGLTLIAQFIVGLAPDIFGWRRSVHRIAAFGMAMLFIPLSLLIITAPHLDDFARFTDIVLLSYMIITFMLVAILGKAKRSYLVFQILYLVAMQTIILVSAYL
jgi:hypothetical protein